MRKEIIIFMLFTLSVCFSTDFGKFTETDVSSYEDLSTYIKVIDIVQNLSNNLTMVYIENTYDSDLYAEQFVINNITIPYEIVNVSLYYNGNYTNVENYSYQNNTFIINGIIIRIGESVLIIKGNNTNMSDVVINTHNIFVLPEDTNFTANLNEEYNFTFTISSYTDINYTINVSVKQDGKEIFNLTNFNVTNFTYQFTVQNISFNTTGDHNITINVTTNVSESTYNDNFRMYYINVSDNSNLPPIITIYSPGENKEYDTNNILVNFSVYDDNLYFATWRIIYNSSMVIYSNISFSNINFSKVFNLPEGSYTLEVGAIDALNNVSSSEVNFSINIPEPTSSNKPPKIVIISPENKTYFSQNVSINIEVYDSNYDYSVVDIFDSEGNLVYYKQFFKNDIFDNIELNKTDEYRLGVVAVDSNGASSYEEVYFYVNISEQGNNEKLEIYNISNSTIINSSVYPTEYEIFGFDPTKKYKIEVILGNKTIGIFDVDQNLGNLLLNFYNVTNGWYNLTFKLIWDNATLDTKEYHILINVTEVYNNSQPSIMIFSPIGVITNNSVEIFVNVSDDNLKYYKIYVMDNYGMVYYAFEGNNSGVFKKVINLTDGNYTLNVVAEDSLGAKNIKNSSFQVVTGNISAPKIKIFTSSHTTYVPYDYINFTVIDPNIKNVYVYIKYGNVMSTAYHYTIDGNFYLPIHFDKEGTYKIIVYAENVFGLNNQSSINITYVVNDSLHYDETLTIITPEDGKTYSGKYLKVEFKINKYNESRDYSVIAMFKGPIKLMRSFDNLDEITTKFFKLPSGNYTLTLDLYVNGKLTDDENVRFEFMNNETISEIPLIKIYNPVDDKTYLESDLPVYFEVLSPEKTYNHYILYDSNNNTIEEKYNISDHWVYKDLLKLKYNKTYRLCVDSYSDSVGLITKCVNFKVKYVNYWVKDIKNKNNILYVTLCSNKENVTLNYSIIIEGKILKQNNVSLHGNCVTVENSVSWCGNLNVSVYILNRDSYYDDDILSNKIIINCSTGDFGESSYEVPENPLYPIIVFIFGIFYMLHRKDNKR